MTEQLNEIIKKHSDKELRMLADDALSLFEMCEEENEWDVIVNKPGFLERMEKVMHASFASGLEDGGFCL